MAELAVLQNISKSYPVGGGRIPVLRDVSLTITEGSFLAIMGASGSGKSTLLAILGCLDRPCSGRYLLAGRETAAMDDDERSDLRLRCFGFIFQSFYLIPQLTVLENIELPLYYLGWPAGRSRQRALELADRVGLRDRLQHRPAELSGGQQQRVAVARALANDPRIILADEPTGNLDSETGRRIMELLASLHRQGKTIVMVTHEQDMAAYASQRIVMRDGRLVGRQDGDVRR